MSTLIRSTEDLERWKASRDLRLFVAREVVPILPREERYRLGGQILEAARSMAANIAGGHGRFHYLDNAKFCRNARGSGTEVLDHLIAAHDEGMVSDKIMADGRAKVSLALKPINGDMADLKRASLPAVRPKHARPE